MSVSNVSRVLLAKFNVSDIKTLLGSGAYLNTSNSSD